jgi:hypothetical protein
VINCQTFRANIQSRDADMLEHLRKCDACLEYAVSADPDNFFRAIGGEELVPPGGIDAFASDVMSQIRVREAEAPAAKRFLVAPRRLAAAAAIIVAIGGSWFGYERANRPLAAPVVAAARKQPLTTKPVVETYQSQNATIVEMPSQGGSDANVVMIFDDALPADL